MATAQTTLTRSLRALGLTGDWQAPRRRAWIMFLVPAVVIYTIFMAYPLINSMRLSLYTGVGFRPDHFVGFDNYNELVTNPIWKDRFVGALRHTFIFFMIHMAVQNSLGLLFATLLSQTRLFGRNIYRTIIFLPATMSVLLTSFLWRLILNPRWGMLKILLEDVGHGDWFKAWLGDEKYALIVVSLVSSWQWVGLPTMMFLAGLINISDELSEAARVDGANGLQVWLRVKLPLLRPIIGIVAILTFIGNFNAFDVVYAMMGAQGPPNYSTDILGTFFYRAAIAGEHPVARPDMGIGAAVATVTFFILMTGVSIWLILSRRGAEEVVS
ncbi:MAG TPA: sugar ABC transporter permease [Aggregatilineaceae bacterium]|nr:sugar ABC transporter permease [Aggregatilineaceae bacterium]